MSLAIKISGWLSFFLSIFYALASIYVLVEEGRISNERFDREFNRFIFFFISSFSTVFYVIATKFGGSTMTDLDKIEFENKMLKLKIEQKALSKELENKV